MIRITDNISIAEKEIKMDFIRASGPGGQNVNKVSSAVHLRFNVLASPSLPEDVRQRLVRLAGKRITEEGILIIHAARFRTQQNNREDAVNRLITLIRKAAARPKKRLKTKPSAASKKRMLENKRIRSQKKRMRGPVQNED